MPALFKIETVIKVHFIFNELTMIVRDKELKPPSMTCVSDGHCC